MSGEVYAVPADCREAILSLSIAVIDGLSSPEFHAIPVCSDEVPTVANIVRHPIVEGDGRVI